MLKYNDQWPNSGQNKRAFSLSLSIYVCLCILFALPKSQAYVKQQRQSSMQLFIVQCLTQFHARIHYQAIVSCSALCVRCAFCIFQFSIYNRKQDLTHRKTMHSFILCDVSIIVAANKEKRWNCNKTTCTQLLLFSCNMEPHDSNVIGANDNAFNAFSIVQIVHTFT